MFKTRENSKALAEIVKTQKAANVKAAEKLKIHRKNGS